MPAVVTKFDATVTPEKIEELVRRIVAAVDPLEVIAFGSRARGDHRENSDLDLAVIVKGTDAERPSLPGDITKGISMSVDLLAITKERYDRFRPWINTVHRQIDREGVRLYESSRKSSPAAAYGRLCQRRTNNDVSCTR